MAKTYWLSDCCNCSYQHKWDWEMGELRIQLQPSYSQWKMNSPVLNTVKWEPYGAEQWRFGQGWIPTRSNYAVCGWIFVTTFSSHTQIREKPCFFHTPSCVHSFPFWSLRWKGRLIPWWLEAWRQASRMILVFILYGEWGAAVSAGGNFVTGETRLHLSLVKYIGTRAVLLGINLPVMLPLQLMIKGHLDISGLFIVVWKRWATPII